MAYIPTEWATGDVITAEKLNKAENGIAANSGMIYVAAAEIQDDAPVVTEGDLDEAIAVYTAGHPVIMTLTNPLGVQMQLHAGLYGSGALFMIGYAAGADLQLLAFTWSSSGLSPWPAT